MCWRQCQAKAGRRASGRADTHRWCIGERITQITQNEDTGYTELNVGRFGPSGEQPREAHKTFSALLTSEIRARREDFVQAANLASTWLLVW